MEIRTEKPMTFEQSFDINDVSFENVSHDFEHRFRHRYGSALDMMDDDSNRNLDATGANALGILEKMAQRIEQYDKNTDFQECFEQLQKEYERFTEV